MHTLAIHPGHLSSYLALRAGGRPHGSASPAGRAGRAEKDGLGPIGHVVPVADGLLGVVDVRGFLVDEPGWWTELGLATSYTELAETLEAMADDGRVSRVLMTISSPGGEVAGVTDAARAVRDLAGVKPVVAHAKSMAASAAYWLASAAGEIIASPVAELGSIGVLVYDIDDSERWAENKIRPVVITTASLKAQGWPGVEWTDEHRDHVLTNITEMDGRFVDAVAAGRGLGADLIREMEGRVFTGAAAVAAGLADRVADTRDIHAEVLGITGADAPGDTTMTIEELRARAGRAGAASATTNDDENATENEPMGVDEIEEAINALEDEDRDDLLSRLSAEEDEEPVEETASAAAKRVRKIAAQYLNSAEADRCVVAALESGETDEASVLRRVCQIQKRRRPAEPASEPVPEPGASAQPVGTGPGGVASGGARQRWDAAVAAHREKHGCNRREAMRAVAAADPDLHRAYLEEASKAVR